MNCTYELGIILPTSDNGFLIWAHVSEHQGQQQGRGGREKKQDETGVGWEPEQVGTYVPTLRAYSECDRRASEE